MRYPVLSGLCLIAKETEQGVNITLFNMFNCHDTIALIQFFDHFRPCKRMRRHAFAGRNTQQTMIWIRDYQADHNLNTFEPSFEYRTQTCPTF